jgi:murein DD-endopeptidase MepM/ murein hydrolase activator NlpD
MRLLLLLVLISISATVADAQRSRHRTTSDRSSIQARQRELLSLQRSIQQREQMIKELAEKEKTTAKAAEQLRQLIERQQRYLRLLDRELRLLDEQLRALQSEHQRHRSDYSRNYEQWRRFIVLLVTADMRDDDDAGLDTAIISAAVRSMDARLHSTQQQRDSTADALNRLRQYRAARQLLLAQQQREQQRLQRMLMLRTQLLEKLRQNRQAIADELRSLRKTIETIKRSIKRLSRTERSSAPKGKSAHSANLAFLRPPVRGAILRGYGEYRHPLTGARAFNPGVDIAVPVGTPIKAPAAGKVVSVRRLPAMNIVVIVEHRDGIRTVYGNVERAYVREGQHVDGGETIGTSGETLSGAFVHFELWHGAVRLDPTVIVR